MLFDRLEEVQRVISLEGQAAAEHAVERYAYYPKRHVVRGCNLLDPACVQLTHRPDIDRFGMYVPLCHWRTLPHRTQSDLMCRIIERAALTDRGFRTHERWTSPAFFRPIVSRGKHLGNSKVAKLDLCPIRAQKHIVGLDISMRYPGRMQILESQGQLAKVRPGLFDFESR